MNAFNILSNPKYKKVTCTLIKNMILLGMCGNFATTAIQKDNLKTLSKLFNKKGKKSRKQELLEIGKFNI